MLDSHSVEDEGARVACVTGASCLIGGRIVERPLPTPECYIVSRDDEALNTYAGLWAIYRAARGAHSIDNIRPARHLPPVVSRIVRRVLRKTLDAGSVRYSSEKLLATGFVFRMGLEEKVRQLASATDWIP